MKNVLWRKTLVLTAVLVFLSLFIYSNQICCMFSATRPYGFPGQYLLLVKNTDSYDEALKINYLNGKELIEQGWKLTYGASVNSSISSSPTINLIFNFLFYLTISFFLVLVIEKVNSLRSTPQS